MSQNGLLLEAHGETDRGVCRDNNEDSFIVAELTRGAPPGKALALRPAAGRSFLFAVADGMGGAPAGEVAAELAIETIYRSLLERPDLSTLPGAEARRVLVRAVEEANTRIYRMGRSSAAHRGMGATVTAVVVTPTSIQYSHVGDSRAYLLRTGSFVQLTHDHSLYNYLVEDCRKSPEEAEEFRNVILQALGVHADVEVDSNGVAVQPGDVLLICSDGLTNAIEDGEIQDALSRAPDASRACADLVSLALGRGGPDNITVITVRLLPAPVPPAGPPSRPPR